MSTDDRKRNARAVELGSSTAAGTVGSAFGAAKLRDAYTEDRPGNPAKLHRLATGVTHTVVRNPARAERAVKTIEHGHPGFKPLLAATALAGVATTARRYQGIESIRQRRHEAQREGESMSKCQLQKFVSAEERKKLADQKHPEAQPNGSFPTQDKKHARLALQFLKDAPPSQRASIKARADSKLHCVNKRGMSDDEKRRTLAVGEGAATATALGGAFRAHQQAHRGYRRGLEASFAEGLHRPARAKMARLSSKVYSRRSAKAFGVTVAAGAAAEGLHDLRHKVGKH